MLTRKGRTTGGIAGARAGAGAGGGTREPWLPLFAAGGTLTSPKASSPP